MLDKNDNLSIRQAQEEDIPLVLDFIKSIAEYEKMLDEVEATEKLLKESLFGKYRAAEVVLAYLDDRAVGFAVYYQSFSTFVGRPGIYLEDLFVYPQYRGKGIGKAMLKYLANLAVKRGYGRIEWSVLNWNTPAIDFYKSICAKPMDEWTVYRMDEKTIKTFAE